MKLAVVMVTLCPALAAASDLHGTLKLCRDGSNSPFSKTDIRVPAGTHYVVIRLDSYGATVRLDADVVVPRGAKCASVAATADGPVEPSVLRLSGPVPAGGESGADDLEGRWMGP